MTASVDMLGALEDDRISQLLDQLVAKAKVATEGQQQHYHHQQQHQQYQHDVDEEEERQQRYRRRARSSSHSPPPSPRAVGCSDSSNDGDYVGAESSPARVELRPSSPASTAGSSEKRSPTALDKVDSIMEKGDSIVSNLLRTKSTIREVLHTGNTIVRLDCIRSYTALHER
eukprot:COSAG02_NODE_1750_length_11068_cov_7.252530_2_plen_172_part_00